jgi:hypothetical protein
MQPFRVEIGFSAVSGTNSEIAYTQGIAVRLIVPKNLTWRKT